MIHLTTHLGQALSQEALLREENIISSIMFSMCKVAEVTLTLPRPLHLLKRVRHCI